MTCQQFDMIETHPVTEDDRQAAGIVTHNKCSNESGNAQKYLI